MSFHCCNYGFVQFFEKANHQIACGPSAIPLPFNGSVYVYGTSQRVHLNVFGFTHVHIPFTTHNFLFLRSVRLRSINFLLYILSFHQPIPVPTRILFSLCRNRARDPQYLCSMNLPNYVSDSLPPPELCSQCHPRLSLCKCLPFSIWMPASLSLGGWKITDT